MRRASLLAALASLLWVGIMPLHAATLTVAVAANAQPAFAELAAAFEAETQHEIRPVYNASGRLTSQIMQGAPFDVFLSADMDYPDQLHRAGHTTEPPRVYAYGTLVLWTLNEFDLSNWQELLSGSTVRKIAIANPKLAPYGRETVKALAALGLEQALQPKLVYGESIGQVNQYTHSRTVDAGFTAKSVVLAPAMRGQGKWVEVPPQAYQPIAQGVVLLRPRQQSVSNAAAAASFMDFMLSPSARAILSRYGYLLP